jgi:hypothetical protein
MTPHAPAGYRTRRPSSLLPKEEHCVHGRCGTFFASDTKGSDSLKFIEECEFDRRVEDIALPGDENCLTRMRILSVSRESSEDDRNDGWDVVTQSSTTQTYL